MFADLAAGFTIFVTCVTLVWAAVECVAAGLECGRSVGERRRAAREAAAGGPGARQGSLQGRAVNVEPGWAEVGWD
jgi:hypothetical protein